MGAEGGACAGTWGGALRMGGGLLMGGAGALPNPPDRPDRLGIFLLSTGPVQLD